jgi:xanthine dehydrogenase YagT iron-sulfur-binding subunit
MPTLSTLLGIGDTAPDFPLVTSDGDSPAMLSGLRGSPVLLILESPHWDPVGGELATMYAGDVGEPAKTRIISDRRPEIASLFGVCDATALFVVDESGVIRWRYVSGVDAIPLSSVGIGSPSHSEDAQGRLMVSRRDFVQAALAALALLAATTLTPKRVRAAVRSLEPPAVSDAPHPVTLSVNGRDIVVDIEPRVTLLDALREYAGLTGSKKGCDHGQCGACTVHVDGRRVLSCMTFAVMQQGKKITTIEGLASGDTLHPMQQAFITHDGFQCGYCTSGQIMSGTGVLREPWGNADDDVREAMSGNICRCGAYPGIVAAVQSVRGSSSSGGAQ